MTLWDAVPLEWQQTLLNVQQDILNIGQILQHEANLGKEIAPNYSEIFAALRIPPETVRVVIVGQDPYPTKGHAMGMAFSVPANTRPLPATLRNILAEVEQDCGASKCRDGDLSAWRKQGVLLLNRVLTIEVGSTDSHKSIGWQQVTRAIGQAVVAHNPHTIGVLWGKQAQDLRDLFAKENRVESAHPSPLSAYRGFRGSRPFSQVNAMLLARGESAIQW